MRIHGHHYQRQSVETARPAQLVLMLYDRALRALVQVRHASLPSDTEVVNRELLRAQAIITELQLALDFESGAPIAGQLSQLYDYCLRRLIDANVRKDLALVDDVVPVIAGLREAWEQACVGTQTLISS